MKRPSRWSMIQQRVGKVGDQGNLKAILEPLKPPPIDLDKFWAELDTLGAKDFLPGGMPDELPAEPDQRIFFGE